MQSFLSYTFGTLIALFPITNPIGAVPIFYSLTVDNTPKYRLEQAKKTAISVVGVLLTFLLVGKLILKAGCHWAWGIKSNFRISDLIDRCPTRHQWIL